MADSRSTASISARQLLKKLPLNLDESESIYDPQQTPNFRLVEQLVRLSQTWPGIVFTLPYQDLDSYDS